MFHFNKYMSKNLSIGLIILFAGIIALGIVFVAFRNGPQEIIPSDNTRDTSFPQSGNIGSGAPPPSTLPSERNLIKITNGAVAGFSVTPFGVRFIEKATGHVFDSSPDGETQTRISNTTIPQIIDAEWSRDASGVIIRYRDGDEIKIASSRFIQSKTDGVFLPAGILSWSYAPEQNRIFYTVKGAADIVGIAANSDNTAQSQIARLPESDFLVRWYTPREISFVSRPSALSSGFLYRYNIDKGAFEKLLSDIPGLEILWSNDKTQILFSRYNQSTKKPNLFVLHVKTGAIEDLGTEGLAQKCAWFNAEIIYCGIPTAIPQSNYPDEWLKGTIAFSDRIWRINTNTSQKTIVKNLSNTDISRILADSKNSYLYFQNKKDGTLWSLQLK